MSTGASEPLASTSILGVEDIDLSDMAFWGRPLAERAAAFALLRGQPAPAFFPEPSYSMMPTGPGYYALTRHAEVTEASRAPEVFSSVPSAVSIPDMPTDFAEYFGSLINMDDPRHAKIRRIVSRAFTPRMLRRSDDQIQGIAAKIVDGLLADGPGDFVHQVAARLPLQFICDMMGIPASHYETVLRDTDVILAGMDPEILGTEPEEIVGRLLAAGQELQDLLRDLGRHRREHPTDDLVSALVNANVDGERLSDQEIGSFFIILAVAGNDTTRNAISYGLRLLTENPDQRELLRSDLDAHLPAAVEEIVRVTSPVIWMRRTLTRDYEMGSAVPEARGGAVPEARGGAVPDGRQGTAQGTRERTVFRKGDKVLLYYWSANRDEAVFPEPERFDITRTPNPHVGFGGPGPHYCLGANLARREITVMFRELLTRVPDIHSVGEPDRLLSSFINGIKRMDCDFTAG